MNLERLYHVSEDPKIKVFIPRPSPSHFDAIHTDVVFAITHSLLHNYLLPRDCPRVTYYPTARSSKEDIEKWMGPGTASHIIAVENKWMPIIQRTTLFVYEMPAQSFTLLDECAGYYISRHTVEPISVKPVYNILEELAKRDVECRVMPSIYPLANIISQSTLNYSLIRMRR